MENAVGKKDVTMTSPSIACRGGLVFLVVMVECVLLSFSAVIAQNEKLETFTKTDTSLVEPGLRLGFNVSNVWGPDRLVEGGDLHFGAMGGGIAQINVNRLFVVETGVTASIKGTRYVDTTEYEVGEKWAIDLFYAEIPVIAKLRFPTDGKIVPFLGVGPSFDLRIYSRKRKDVSNAIRQYPFNDTTTIVDIAATGVAGINVMTRDRGHLIGEIRAMLGLLDMRDEKTMLVRNWSGTVSIAYVFNLRQPKPLW